MVGWILASYHPIPEDTQVLILGICESVVLAAKETLQVWLNRWVCHGEISLDGPGGPYMSLQGLPSWSRGQASTLPMQRPQGRPLVRELDPTSPS